MPISSWVIQKQADDLSGLVLVKTASDTSQLEHDEILVEMRAASLNYRDLVVAQGKLGLKSSPDVISGSDGSGVVLSIGDGVTSFHPGDRVVTHLVPSEFPSHPELNPLSDSTLPHMGHICAGLGQELNGTLTTHGVFKESCLVKLEGHMTFEQAATLTCSGITAWNAVMGLQGREIKKGDWILVQGTGGVSIAAMQFSLAAGATVIATTSSDAKATKLKELGAHHVVNYRENTQWGLAAKNITPGNRGVDVVVDVGGNATLGESLNAVRIDGVVVLAGLLGGNETVEPLMKVLSTICIVRGVVLGTKKMMKDMIRFVEQNDIKMALDDHIFSLEDTQEAIHRLKKQQHFAKVIIQIAAES